jgi:hypothetical protein
MSSELGSDRVQNAEKATRKPAPPRSEGLDPQAIAGRLGVHAPVVARELALLPPPRRAKAPKVSEAHRSDDRAADDLAVLVDAANRWLAG